MSKYLPLTFKVLIICLAFIAGAYLFDKPGYVQLAYGGSYIETTLLTLLIVLVCLWVGEKLLRIIFGKIWGLFGLRQKRADNALDQGLTAYLAKDWKRAEKLLGHNGGKGSPPAKNLYAAMAANALGDQNKVKKHLNGLESKHADGKLLKAELMLEQNELEQALAISQTLFDKKPKDNNILSLHIRVLAAKEAWEQILPLLPRIEKQGLYEADSYHQYAAKVVDNALNQTARSKTFEDVEQQFNQLPSKIKKQNYSLNSYIALMVAHGQSEKAQTLLLKSIKKGNIKDHLPLLRKTSFHQPLALNQYLQKALKDDEHNITLLCALGHLAAGNQDLPLAAKALEKAYEEQDDNQISPEDLKVLADAYARTGQHSKAVVVYQHLL